MSLTYFSYFSTCYVAAMSTEQIMQLVERVNADPDVQARFRDASGVEEIAAIAGELGFEVDAESLEAIGVGAALSEDELADVAGGIAFPDGRDDLAFLAKTW